MPLTLIITNAGLDALVDAENSVTDPLVITEIGLSAQAVAPAPTLEVLPGEFKRIATVSGDAVAPNIIHLTAQDPGGDIYDLRSLALYCDDGTLFAVYGQEEPIFTKVSIATFLLALDLAFSGDIAGNITFGDASFLYPPATETVKGVAELATQPEVDAGVDDERIVTALKLAGRLAPLLQSIADEVAARIAGDGALQNNIDAESLARGIADSALQTTLNGLLARTITGGGLATGGGTLAANRVITVTAASGAEIATGAETSKAVTPAAIAAVPQSHGSHVIGLGGAIMKMGVVSVPSPTTTNVSFPLAFPNDCNRVLLVPLGDSDNSDESDERWWVSAQSSTGFTITTAGTGTTINYGWVAFGH